MKSLVLLIVIAALCALAHAQPMTLEYQGRYNCQSGEPDHLMTAAGLSGDRAIVGGNRGLALVDLSALPVQGTRSYLHRLTGIDARDLNVTRDEQYVFVNGHRGSGTFGFDVVKITGNTLTKVLTRNETDVLYEKMFILGDHLYVAAHAYGLRIFDIRNPANPTLVGRIDQGFVDAFAVAVEGNTAYVADGAGGLKIVDVTSKTSPRIIAGETLATAVGTAEDVTVKNGRVYVAAGGEGLLAYAAGKLGSRTRHAVAGAAESLCWVGDHLAVGTISGVSMFRIGQGTTVTLVASEIAHRRGTAASLRLANDVGPASGDRVLVADWNFMDVYELKAAAASTQPDIDCDVQRIRFAPGGGTHQATLTNNGQGTLNITSVTASPAAFTVNYAGGSLLPGQRVTFQIRYLGGSLNQGTGNVLVYSNDPDESPLPIQVFGNTTYLDPGESAVDFTVPTLIRDPQSGKPVAGSPFTLSQYRGTILWFQVFATW